MKKIIALTLLLAVFCAQAYAVEQPGFKIDAETLDTILADENPLQFLKEPLEKFFIESPTALAYFAAEMNLNNGATAWGGRNPVGEVHMFGGSTNAYRVRDMLDNLDYDTVLDETLRILFGPWYSKNARTYSTKKNLGWFPYHLDLNTGEWFLTDPLSPDLGIRVFHYTDYDGRNRTTTLALSVDWDSLEEGFYTCYLTLIRKPTEPH